MKYDFSDIALIFLVCFFICSACIGLLMLIRIDGLKVEACRTQSGCIISDL